ncbi:MULTISPECIES: hypothetical protein [Pseudomonas]|uniref:hypothetical protein n=1 Tax=Pseudomonas TaxID=286 RepID=UPI001269CCE3|nr:MULTISPECIES: hypothetical protein [Pseudomonas]WAB89911.1 hypothetical protein OSS47_17295 [Pseudomonas citronellolis]
MKQQMKDRQAERASVVTRMEELREQLPGLEQAEKDAPITHNHLGNVVSTVEKRVAEAARMEAASELAMLERRLDWLDQWLAHAGRVVNADAEIAAAQKLVVECEQKCSRLSGSSHRVRKHVEQIEQEQQTAEDAASQGLQNAVQALARATADGDTQAAAAAQSAMQGAREAGQHASQAAANNASLLAALVAEGEALRQESEQAEQDLAGARARVKAGQRAKHGAEWDRLADELARVGVKLAELDTRHPLTQVKIPRFAPGAGQVDFESLLRTARGAA